MRMYCIEITGNNVEMNWRFIDPCIIKMDILVSYSFVYIQISLTSLALKCKITKEASQANLN